MARTWKAPVDFRSAPSQVVGEQFEVINGVGLLAEAPADPTNPAFPIVVTVGGFSRSRVTGVPGAGQFRIRAQTILGVDGAARTEYLPILEFHSSDNGLSGSATYWRTGTVVTGDFFDLLKWFLTPITGLATLSELQALHPATSDVTRRGRPGDQAYLSSGVAYFSDGSQWRQFSAVQPNNWSESIQMLGRFGITQTSAFTAAWTAANALATAHGLSFASSYSTPGQAAQIVAAALGLQFGSSFVATWAQGQTFGAGLGLTTASNYTAGGGGGGGTSYIRRKPANLIASSGFTSATLAALAPSPDVTAPVPSFLAVPNSPRPSATEFRVSFEAFTSPLSTGADAQKFRVRARMNGAAAASAPARVELWHSGSLVRAGPWVDVTAAAGSTTGQLIEFTWSASEVPSTSGVECRFYSPDTGGTLSTVAGVDWVACVAATVLWDDFQKSNGDAYDASKWEGVWPNGETWAYSHDAGTLRFAHPSGTANRVGYLRSLAAGASATGTRVGVRLLKKFGDANVAMPGFVLIGENGTNIRFVMSDYEDWGLDPEFGGPFRGLYANTNLSSLAVGDLVAGGLGVSEHSLEFRWTSSTTADLYVDGVLKTTGYSLPLGASVRLGLYYMPTATGSTAGVSTWDDALIGPI